MWSTCCPPPQLRGALPSSVMLSSPHTHPGHPIRWVALPPARRKVRRVVEKALAGQTICPKDVYILILRSHEFITSHGEADFAGVIKDLEMR